MTDGLAAMLWVGSTALLVSAAWRVARAVDPTSGPFLRALHAAIIAWSVLVGCTLLLGMTGRLISFALQGSVSALSLIMYRSASTLGRWTNGTNLAGGSSPGIAPSGDEDLGGEPIYYLWAWGAIGAVCVARVIRYALLEYPSDWDTLNYHLPLIHAWLRARSLFAPDCEEWYVPGTNESIGLWLAAPFSGDFLIGLINLPAAFVLALSLVELGRQVGIPTPIRHLTGLVAFTAEVVIRQLLTAKNDTAAAAFFVAALAFGFRHATEGRRSDLGLAAVGIGLLVGTKYYAVGYCAVAVGTLLLCRFMIAGWRAAIMVGVAAMIGGIVFGGYWYARNILVTGTPFYPKGYSTGTDVLSQWRPNGTWNTTLFGHRSPEVLPLLLQAIWKHAGPLHYMAFLLLPGSLAWLIGGHRWLNQGERTKGKRIVRCGLAAAVVGAVLIWGIIPFAVETEPGSLNFLRVGYLPVRFGLCFLTISLVSSLTLIGDCWSSVRQTQVRAALRIIALGAVSWHLYFVLASHVIAGGSTIIILTAAIIIDIALLVREILYRGLPVPRLLLATAGAMAVVAGTCNHLAGHWHAHFIDHYTVAMFDTRVFSKLNEWRVSRLFYLGYRGYPFAGSHRQTSVCRDLRLPTSRKFYEYLALQEVTHVVVAYRATDWPGHIVRIHEWMESSPQVFRLVLADNAHLVYRIDRAELIAELAFKGRLDARVSAARTVETFPTLPIAFYGRRSNR